MSEFSKLPSAQLGIDLLFEALRVYDDRLASMAMVLLSRTGNVFHQRMMDAALETRYRTNHRVRHLRTILATGVSLSAEHRNDLWQLIGDRNREVRQAAAEVISWLGGGQGPSEEEVNLPGLSAVTWMTSNSAT